MPASWIAVRTQSGTICSKGSGGRVAARECREETGLIVTVGAVLAVHSNCHDPERLTVGIWFAGDVVGGELAPGDDLDRAAFFPLIAPPEPLAFPTDRRVLAELQAGALDRIPDSAVG